MVCMDLLCATDFPRENIKRVFLYLRCILNTTFIDIYFNKSASFYKVKSLLFASNLHNPIFFVRWQPTGEHKLTNENSYIIML